MPDLRRSPASAPWGSTPGCSLSSSTAPAATPTPCSRPFFDVSAAGVAPTIDASISGAALREEIETLHTYLASRPSPAPILTLDGPDALSLRRTAAYLAAPDALLVLRGAAVAESADPEDLVARALREADLTGVALCVEKARALEQAGRPSMALHRLLASPCRSPRILLAEKSWNLPETRHGAAVLSAHLPAPDQAAREALWRDALDEWAEDVNLGELAGRFRLHSAQIDAAVDRVRARRRSRPEEEEALEPALYAACRAQCVLSLDGLAQRLESVHKWDDLVVPERVSAKLRSMESWLRFRHVVHGEWGFGKRVNTGHGMAVMFTGVSGTGKTMAAGILGRALDLDLYRIDLSSVVSKYIGETEKNLSKIFDTAEAANAILFFDEADALFGKRSEVKDAHDRHANIEVSYLLQRMEDYDGIAVLATNIKGNLDVAFARRLQMIVEFPFPTVEDRERIWRRLFSDRVPLAEDVDLGFMARQFAIAGGSIKNCALAGALAAAAERKPVEMRHLVVAMAREFEKLGKPITQGTFGAWGHLV